MMSRLHSRLRKLEPPKRGGQQDENLIDPTKLSTDTLRKIRTEIRGAELRGAHQIVDLTTTLSAATLKQVRADLGDA